MANSKTLEYKVFSPAGVYITSYEDVISNFNYSQAINTPGNGIDIELGRTADTLLDTITPLTTEADETLTTEDDETLAAMLAAGDVFGTGTNIDLNYGIEVWLYYGDIEILVDETGASVIDENGTDVGTNWGAPQGIKLFTGYISGYHARYGKQDTVLLHCLPYGAELDNHVIKSGETTTVAYNSYDPSAILKDVIDKYRTDGGVVNYSTSTIATTGTVVSYTYKLNTTLEGVKKVLELAPSGWWWYLNVGQNMIYLQPTPTSATHTFVLGQHISDLSLERTIEGLVNTFYFQGGNLLYKKYTDATSIAAYRVGLERQTDQRYTDATSMDIVGGSLISDKKNPRYRGSLTIQDGAYEIETIELGQLVSFANFDNFIDTLTLQIVSINYNLDSITVELDTLTPQPNKRLEDIKRNLIREEQIDVPATPS